MFCSPSWIAMLSIIRTIFHYIMRYFIHDTSSFDDEKVTMLYLKFGYEGVGLFYTTLEKIAKQEKPINTIVLKSQLKIGKRLEKCWKFMEEIDLIQSKNGETFNEQLLNFSEKYQIKKEKNRKKVSEWREKQLDSENVTSTEPVRNPRKVKESKVKESKVEYHWTEDEFSQIWEFWKKYKKQQYNFTYKEIGEQGALSKLVELSGGKLETAMLIIKQSIQNGWKGFFELKGIAKTEEYDREQIFADLQKS